MASIARDPGGRRRIIFGAPDGTRKTLYLGKVPQKTAEQIKVHVEALAASLHGGSSPPDATARWADEIGEALAAKLARAGLLPERKRPEGRKLGPFLERYLDRRIDAKPASKVVWGHASRNLKEHFGPDYDMGAVTAGDAEDFKMYLIGLELAPSTIHKRVQVSRMFFRDAQKRGIIRANPFADVKHAPTTPDDRQRFVHREEIEQILSVCNPTWRLIVALGRYGGLRCPSEVLSLRWEGVNWELGRFVVDSPKTEHHAGKGRRVVPIFPELRPFLADALEIARDRT